MKSKILSLVILVITFSTVQAQVNITFELNTATMTSIDTSGLYVAGGSDFGFPGDNRLTDPDGDGIYSITIQKNTGVSSHYTFLNGNCGDWSCKENIAGLPCSDPANYNDRFLPAVMSDTTIKACFGTCDSDGSCTIITDSIDITFELNTSTIDVDAGGIFLAGGGNFGNPGDNPMVDPEGDGIYTITVRKAKGFSSHYTFLNGNCPGWDCKEDLTGLPCGDPNSFNDRFLASTTSDTTILACFAQCTTDGSCETANINRLTKDKNLFSIRPTLVDNHVNITYGENYIHMEKEMIIMNSVGQIFETVNIKNEATSKISTEYYSNGFYYVTIKTDNAVLTKKFLIQR